MAQVLERIGLRVDTAPSAVDNDGTRHGFIHAAEHLQGPAGILQGGLVAGALMAAARHADPFGAPATAVNARLHRPTPVGAVVDATVRPRRAAHYDVQLQLDGQVLASGDVELAGVEPVPFVGDLQELGPVPIPESRPQWTFPVCWVCGPDNEVGLHLHPAWHDEQRLSIPWLPEETFADARDVVDPVVVCAVLDCPSSLVATPHLDHEQLAGAVLSGLRVQFFRDVPILEPLRVVAILDDADGRKIRSRSAIVDEDGALYAVASAFHVGMETIPRIRVADRD